MSNAVQKPFAAIESETLPERDVRLEWERDRIVEADADIAAGRIISGEAALDWLDRWAAGDTLADPAID